MYLCFKAFLKVHVCVLCVHFLHTCLSVSKIARPQISFLSSPEFPVLAEHRVAPKKLMFPLQLASRMCAEMLAVCAEFPVKVRGISPPTFLLLLAGLNNAIGMVERRWTQQGGRNTGLHSLPEQNCLTSVGFPGQKNKSVACLSQYYRVSVTADNCPPEGQEVL